MHEGPTAGVPDLRLALVGDPNGISPLAARTPAARALTRAVFSGLFDVDPRTGRLVPGIAAGFTRNAAATVYRFRLRAGVRFQGGGAVTAETFVHDWRLVRDPRMHAPGARTLAPLARVRALGPRLLEVALARPFRALPFALSDPGTWAFPPEAARTPAAARRFALRPRGSGPFSVAALRPGRGIVLRRFAGYAGPRPAAGEVRLRVVVREQDALALLRRGALDAAAVPAAQLRLAQTDPRLARHLLVVPLADVVVVRMDPHLPAALRRAVALAAGAQADGLVPPGMPGVGGARGAYASDPGRARRLVTGLASRRLPLWPVTDEVRPDAVALAARLRAVGLAPRLVGGPAAVRVELLRPPYPSADGVLVAAGAAGTALARARAATGSARAGLYAAAERALAAQERVVPLAYRRAGWVAAPRLRRLVIDAEGQVDLLRSG